MSPLFVIVYGLGMWGLGILAGWQIWGLANERREERAQALRDFNVDRAYHEWRAQQGDE